MERNSIILDTNSIIRFLLDDVHEQYIIVSRKIKDNKCFTILPVIQETVYVFEMFYKIERKNIKNKLLKLIDLVSIDDEDILINALNYYDNKPKLDFVDCILCAYKDNRNIGIFTFDKKLNNVLYKKQ